MECGIPIPYEKPTQYETQTKELEQRAISAMPATKQRKLMRKQQRLSERPYQSSALSLMQTRFAPGEGMVEGVGLVSLTAPPCQRRMSHTQEISLQWRL